LEQEENEMKQSVRRKFRSGFPILITESNKDFASLRKALNKEIRPNSVIERELVEDYVALTWDIRRCRRVRSEIINSALREALENILKQLLPSDNYENYLEHQRAAEDLARRWLEDREAKTEVIKLLRKFQLDETAIEAEAFRLRGEDLECLDRMLALEMARRDKVIFVLAEYRHTLAEFLQQGSDQILEEDETPRLVAVAKRAS
jgi:molecular chaperone GrpE (heat shock protein)